MSTIVFVHAFGSSSDAWAPQMRGLGGRHRALAPDLPGHGDLPGPFSLDRATQVVSSAIDEAGDDVYLVGISGGAVVCLLTYLAHGPEIAGLVLSGALARPPRWFAVQRALTRLLPEPALVRGMRPALAGGNPEHAQAAATDLRRCGKPTLVAAQRDLAKLDLRSKLGRVTAPALVLCGADDRPNVPLSRELAAGLPRAELRVVAGANHLWNLQQPDEFNAMLSAFVEP